MIPDQFNAKNTILLAIGNSSRGDDGLGWAFAEALEGGDRFQGDIVYRYQLQVEDAELISHYPQVVFVDASQEEALQTFKWTAIYPQASSDYSSHRQQPEVILQLCLDLFGALPRARQLAIRGYQWELGQSISPRGWNNLEEAVAWFFSEQSSPIGRN